MAQFSLRWLLVFVAFVAGGTITLRYASQIMSACLSIAWLVFLMAAVLGAIYRRERQRAFWVGCCVFGWSFAAYGTLSGEKATAFDQAIEATFNAVSWNMKVDNAAGNAHARSGGKVFSDGRQLTAYFPAEQPFKQAAKTLVSFLIAFLGGLAAQWFYATRDQAGAIA